MSHLTGFTRESLLALSAALSEPDWVLQRRLAAFDQFVETPYPDTLSLEDWRRTDVSRVPFDTLADVLVANGAQPKAAPAAPEAIGRLQFVDGKAVASELREEVAAQGVVLCSLSEAVAHHPELVREYFMTQCVRPDEGKFTLLHAAFWNQGTFVHVPAGVSLDGPLLVEVELDGAGSLLHHSLVIIGEGAQAAVVEEFRSAEGVSGLSVPVAEVFAGDRANVAYANVQNWGKGVYEFGTKRVSCGADAQVSFCIGQLGGKLSKSFVGAALNGRGGNCDLLGFYFPGAGQHVDQTTLQDHRVAQCTSNLLFKGALADKARSVFRGVINVHGDAQQTDAYQTNNNLLLGEDARADSMPVLEILADDVKCSHGATLAHLDSEDLFYLMSRGLPRPAAQRMVVTGYFEPVLDRIPVASVRERLQRTIGDRLDRQADRHGGMLG